MTLDELIKQLTRIREECNYEAHPFGKTQDVRIYSGEDSFIIEEIDPDQCFGCGCFIGATIYLKKEIDEQELDALRHGNLDRAKDASLV